MKLTNSYYIIAYLTLLLHLLQEALSRRGLKSFSIQNETDVKTFNKSKSNRKHLLKLKSANKSNSTMESKFKNNKFNLKI